MPVNQADMQSVGAVLASPIISAAAAIHEGAGWFAPVYAVVGLGLGIAVAHAVSFVAYRMIPDRARSSRLRRLGSDLAYLIGAPLVATSGLILIGWTALNLAARLHYSK